MLPKNRRHWFKRRTARVLFAALLLAFIVLNAGAALHAWRLTRFVDYGNHRPVPEKMSMLDRVAFAVTGGFSPKSKLKATPAFPYHTFKLSAPANLTLQAWESTGHTATSGTVILCHGHGASRSAILHEAQHLYDLGMRVVMFDFRAHGHSTGEICSIGYYEADDVKAAWDYVTKNHPGDSVYLYGVSMGAVAAARAIAVHNLNPEAVILDMPFNRLVDAVQSRVSAMGFPSEPAASLLTFWGGVHLGYWGFDHTTANYVSRITCPILLQWGTDDKRVSKSEIEAIRDAATAGPLMLQVYKGLGHKSLGKAAPEMWSGSVLDLIRQAQLDPKIR